MCTFFDSIVIIEPEPSCHEMRERAHRSAHTLNYIYTSSEQQPPQPQHSNRVHNNRFQYNLRVYAMSNVEIKIKEREKKRTKPNLF